MEQVRPQPMSNSCMCVQKFDEVFNRHPPTSNRTFCFFKIFVSFDPRTFKKCHTMIHEMHNLEMLDLRILVVA